MVSPYTNISDAEPFGFSRVGAPLSPERVTSNGAIPAEVLKFAITGAGLGIWDWNLASGKLFWSKQLERIFNLAPKSFDGRYDTFLMLVHPEDRPQLHQQIQSVMKRPKPYRLIFRPASSQGRERWLSMQGQVFSRAGTPIRMSGIVLDVTQQKQAELSHFRQRERERMMAELGQKIRLQLDLDHVIEQTVDSVRQFLQADRVVIAQRNHDPSFRVIQESRDQQFESMMGWRVRELGVLDEQATEFYQQGRRLVIDDIYAQNLPPQQRSLLEFFQVRAAIIVPLLREKQLWGLLAAHQCRADYKWPDADVQLLQNLADQVSIAIQQATLYQKLQKANGQLQQMAFLDGLTGLANRRRFDQYIHREWRRLSRERGLLSLIMVDIDHFKDYNDRYGHQAGDKCLRAVASKLGKVPRRPADLAARYGGEEFSVILPNTTLAGAEKIAEDIRLAARQLQIPHQSSIAGIITVSLGVACCQPTIGTYVQDLIGAADQALYQAKAEGRDCFRSRLL